MEEKASNQLSRDQARKIKHLREAHLVAHKNKGKCLSSEYTDAKTKLLWECGCGNHWIACLNNIKNGQWCPICAIKRVADSCRGTIEDICEIALKKGGVCCSESYIDVNTQLLFICAFGHEFLQTPGKIKQGRWCSFCSKIGREIQRKKKHFLEAQIIAQEKCGKCLSPEYTNAKTNLLWECACGNQWYACLNSIKNGQWCPPCGTKRMADGCRGTLQEMQEIAEKRGGKCLEEAYIDANTKMRFSCINKHEFFQNPSKIKAGRWCPQCDGFMGEEICRFYLENIFLANFPKVRPTWLKIGKSRLELDGYAESIGVAFEHHGKYHYGLDGYYAKNQKDLDSRKEKDLAKERLCIEHKVKLLVIPELFSLTPLVELGDIIKKQCQTLQIDIPNFQSSTKFDFSEAYKYSYGETMLIKLRHKALEKGGESLATSYSGFQQHLPFKCAKGHITLMNPYNVLKDHWCNECNGKAKLRIEVMHAFAVSRGGVCLSSKYKGIKTPMDWICKYGFAFTISYSRLKKRKRFCTCAKCDLEEKKLDLRFLNPLSPQAEGILEKLKQIARDRDGECMAISYQGMHTPLLFRCVNSHKSLMRPVNVLNGSWCNKCSGKERLTITDMQIFASKNGGNCLSKSYINNKAYLKWRCKNGFVFKATFTRMRERKYFCSCDQCLA